MLSSSFSHLSEQEKIMEHLHNDLANVILVDDSPIDLTYARLVLDESNIVANIVALNSGIQLVTYLKNEAPFHEAQFPDLILLDLNMPNMSGLDVLAYMTKERLISEIAVIICSRSDADIDMELAKRMGALEYIVKPLHINRLFSALSKLDHLHLHEENEIKFIRRSA